jgi:hypothetical protein
LSKAFRPYPAGSNRGPATTGGFRSACRYEDEVQSILAKDIPMLPLFFSVEYTALNDKVKGFEWTPDEIPRFRDLWKAEK